MGKLHHDRLIPDPRTLRRLYAALKETPPNIGDMEFKTTWGSFRVTFRQQGEPPAVTGSLTPPPAAPKLVPGTIYPDDESPIDAADLVLHPIDLGEEN